MSLFVDKKQTKRGAEWCASPSFDHRPASGCNLDGLSIVQVFEVFKHLSPACGLWTALLTSQNALSTEIEAMQKQPINVVVATPGRLRSHLDLDTPSFNLTDLKFLVRTPLPPPTLTPF